MNKSSLTVNEIKNLRAFRRALNNLAAVTTLRPDGRIRRNPEFNVALHIAAIADDAFMTRPDKLGYRHIVRMPVWSKYCAIRATFAKKSRINDRLLNILTNHVYEYRHVFGAVRFAR